MFTPREDILMTLFHCGICDLSLLDGIQYDASDVLERLYGYGLEELDVNAYVHAAFEIGFLEIQDAVDNRVAELKEKRDVEGLDEDEKEELDNILQLDNNADMASYHNFLDTNAYFVQNGEIYHRYFQDALDKFAYDTDFTID